MPQQLRYHRLLRFWSMTESYGAEKTFMPPSALKSPFQEAERFFRVFSPKCHTISIHSVSSMPILARDFTGKVCQRNNGLPLKCE